MHGFQRCCVSDAGAVLDLFLYFEEEVLRGGALPLPYFLVVILDMLCYNVLADKLEFDGDISWMI